jgi:L,D-peptidoglycan transpeptidase YkuD (ErfK/YbiS/YcfS/YnhG family)
MIFRNKKTTKTFPFIRFSLILTVVLSLSACIMRPSLIDKATLPAEAGLPENVSQIILVKDDSFLFFTSRKIYALEKHDSAWHQTMEPIDAVVGRNGFAPRGEKREGDGRTPSGLYRMGTAFGYAPSVPTRMPYRQTLADDLWIDDPNAPDYNRWVKLSETRALSYEKMRREDDLYKYGIVIEYNTHPVIKDHGSAIFLHVRATAGSTTAGCVAISEEDILKILAWLNPAANPVIVINPDTM